MPRCHGSKHYLFRCNVEFVPLYVLESLWLPVLKRLLSPGLCHLPITKFEFHCHCADPSSLQCLTRKQLLMDFTSGLHLHLPRIPPWTNCCSQLAYYCVATHHIITTWLFNAGQFVKCAVDLDVNFIPFYVENVMFICFECDNHTLSMLIKLLHDRINLPEGKGYHFGNYNVKLWKGLETATLNSGYTCTLRFIHVGGQDYQERYLKRLMNESEKNLNKRLRFYPLFYYFTQ